MANTNTVAALYNQTAAITSTTETAFSSQNPIGGSSTALFPLSTTRALIGVSSNIFDGKPFRIRIAGKVTAGASLNTTVQVYWNSAANTNLTTFTGDISVLTTGTMASGAAASLSFYHTSLVLWDSVSQQIAAFSEAGGLKNIPTTPAVLTAAGAAVISATNPVKTAVTAVTSLNFFSTVTFGTANASNTCTLTEFAIDQI